MRFLIVDDSEVNLYILETLLKESGYEVVSAGNGAEALEKLRTESIDMIISDILMPVMDGFKFCKEVKEKDELKNIPFIFYAATYKDIKDEELALKLGADKYILKPTEPDELIKIIQGMIRDVEEGKFEPTKPALAEEKEVFKLYSERLVNKLEKKMLDLEREVAWRKEAEERIEHLNLVLRAIRDVNQLIVRERDRDRLIQDACGSFIKNRGFHSAWIALVDESFRLVTAAEAGLGKTFQPLLKNLKQGNLPYCVRRVLAKPGILTIKDPASTCGDCPLSDICKERAIFCSRLEHGGKIYGILTISFAVEHLSGKAERSLFEEIVGDIAYALHHIELEEEHKKGEEELKKSEERYKELVEKAGIAILIDNVEGNIEYANKKAAELYGYSLREMKGQSIQTLVHPDDVQIVTKFHKARIQGKQAPSNYVYRGVRKDGSVRYIELDTTPIKKGESYIGTRLYIRDITERKNAEEALRQRTHDLGERVKELNCLYEIAEISRKEELTVEEVLEKTVLIIPPSWQYPEITGSCVTFENRKYKTKNFKETKWIQRADITINAKKAGLIEVCYLEEKPEDYEGPFLKEERNLIDAVAIRLAQTIKQKQAENQIKAALKENEVLLQEVHHRVKNNMQIISSLFSLQSGHIRDKQTLEIFKSSQNRVRSMALIHERLYKSKDMARVDFAEYTQGLTTHLFSSYGINTNIIKHHIDIKDISLDINTAIPCSLIINELISNSLKHAFPAGKKGKIKIAIHTLNKNEIELVVSDTGVGLPKKMDFRKTESLGLHLVNLLAEDQLHGDIKLDTTKGTSFHIRFRRKR